MKSGDRLGAALAALPPICGAPLGESTLERCSLPPSHDGLHGRREPRSGTVHFDVRFVNPERATGVRMMVHVPRSEVPRLIRKLADGLMGDAGLISVPVAGEFHVGRGAEVSGAPKD